MATLNVCAALCVMLWCMAQPATSAEYFRHSRFYIKYVHKHLSYFRASDTCRDYMKDRLKPLTSVSGWAANLPFDQTNVYWQNGIFYCCTKWCTDEFKDELGGAHLTSVRADSSYRTLEEVPDDPEEATVMCRCVSGWLTYMIGTKSVAECVRTYEANCVHPKKKNCY